MNTKIINGWEKIVNANVYGWNKQQDFFVNGWNAVKHRFDWLPEMFAVTETEKDQGTDGGSDCNE